MSAAPASGNVIRKYLPVYFVLLGIFLVEVFLSFRDFSTPSLVVMLPLPCSVQRCAGFDVFHASQSGAAQSFPFFDSGHDFRFADDEYDLVRQRPTLAHEAAWAVVWSGVEES